MRKPWKELIKKFVNTFFSKSILCIMDEEIDDLEGHKRTPDAMGKDIFKVTKEKRALQKAVKKLLEDYPGLGVKPLLAKLREQQRNLGREAKEEKRKQRRADDKAKQQKNVESRMDPGNKEVAVAAQPAAAQPAAAVALAAASLTLTATHEALEAVKAESEAKAKKKEEKEDEKKKKADEKMKQSASTEEEAR